MALLKIKASTADYGFMKNYLEKEDRALAVDLYNMVADKSNWDIKMKSEKDNYLEHAKRNLSKVAKRNYIHFIISPDPRDEVTLDELRDFSTEWCENNLCNYQAAITYHNDNKSGILHAHVIVNNYRRFDKCFSSYLSNKNQKQIQINTQQMCENRGWHSFDAENYEHDPKDLITTFQSDEQMEKINKAKDFYTTQSKYKGKAEREILESGNWSWKEDLRVRVDIARSASESLNEYKRALHALGVKYKDNAKKNDFIYIHPDNENWKCGGNKLGRMYSYQSVKHHFSNKQNPPYGILSSMDFCELAKRCGINSIKIYETVTEQDYTLQEFGDALSYSETNNIHSEGDFNKLINHYENENNTEKVEQLNKYKMICTGLLDRQELIKEEPKEGEGIEGLIEKYKKENAKYPNYRHAKTQKTIRQSKKKISTPSHSRRNRSISR